MNDKIQNTLKLIKKELRSTIQCPNCKEYNVESSRPYHDHIIWYDCNTCGEEWDGEEPYDSDSNWEWVEVEVDD